MQTSHHQFFTSLNRLEKRLKLENPESPPPPPPELTNATQQSDSLGTPIFLNPTPANTNTSNPQESEAPNEFLPTSPDPPPREDQSGPIITVEKSSLDHDIELLMELLGLSESSQGEGVGCDEGFYGKIVGAKGPKSGKEAERLEGWIKCFSEGEIRSPLGLAHLLLGKAAFVRSSDDGGVGFVFPCSIGDFLQTDPPVD